MKYVIIGAGTAGITAAQTLRELSEDARILLISKDQVVHSRCMLHYYMSGERDARQLNFTRQDFFEQARIEWMPGKEVTAVNAKAKTVTVDGEEIAYDKLLIATGSNSFIPPVGALPQAPNVFGLRDLSDADRIMEKAKNCKNIVVMGGGLVGLDAAYALLHLGKKVTVVEMASQILPMNLDGKAALVYQELFEKAGGCFHLLEKVVDTVCNDKGEITALVLEKGKRVFCQMVIVATGVRPATSLAQDSLIALGKGIQVDSSMQTNIPDVYAAGDVTGLSEIWPSATMQGKVAAYNMAGQSEWYQETSAIKNTINFFGLQTLSIGDCHPKEDSQVYICEDRNRYCKYIVENNVVRGVLLQGNIDNSGFWQYLIQNQVDIGELEKPVWKLSYADFFQMDEQGRYQWVSAT